jgi:lauroyl/myristoyl acyltransferase
MSDRIRFKHRLEYAAFRAAMAGGMRLSDGSAARVGAALGGIGYPLGLKRDVVERNIRIAFPDADAARVHEIARASYGHLGRETLMMLRLSNTSRDTILARTRIVGEEMLRAEYDKGNGIVMVAGHLGNWEIGAAMLAARGYAIDVIAKSAANPLFYSRVLAARARLGIGVIDFKAASKQALKALRAGHMVAFAADQHAGNAGLHVPFFGRNVSMYRGPALMALRTGAPMFLTVPLRTADGNYEMTLRRIEVAPTGDNEADVLRVTREYALGLEEEVRRAPEQYLWHHRRWRTL